MSRRERPLASSVATVSLSGTLVEKLEAAAAAGFTEVEIFEHDLLAGDLSPEEVRSRCAGLGLTINLFQPFRDLDSTDPGRFADNLRRARAKFALMDRLGVDLVLVCSSVGADAVPEPDRLAGQLHALGDLAQEHGVRVAYEALAWGTHVDDYRTAARAVAAADHPHVGTCLDSFHILSRGGDPAGILELPGESLFFLQLADAPRLAMDVLQWSRHYRCFPGQGGLNVTDVALNAVLAGYRGPLSLEVFNDVFRQAPARETARDAFRSLVHLQDQMRQRVEQHRAEGVRALAHELDTVEALLHPVAEPPHPHGLAFVELDDDDAGSVAALLDRVGFARARTAPDATAWVHDDVWIATRPGGTEAAEVTGLGLRVQDPDGAAARAGVLGCRVERVEALGRDLPAVDGPGDLRVTFCPELVPTGPDAPEVPGLGRIDHVALTQPWHEYDGATLFLTSVLGLTAQSSLDVPDPYGLLRSKALTSDRGEVSIALNVPPRRLPGSTSARGSGTAHIAFRTDDLVATAAHLRGRGVPLLRVSDNYYEDLQALYGLEEDRVRVLREHAILLDRDGDGEYLQLFTLSAGGVFLEFVERTGGYAGFGVRNAPFRLAAQSRVQRARPGDRPVGDGPRA